MAELAEPSAARRVYSPYAAITDAAATFAALPSPAEAGDDAAFWLLSARCRAALGQAHSAVLDDLERAFALDTADPRLAAWLELTGAFVRAMGGSDVIAERELIHDVLVEIDTWDIDDPVLSATAFAYEAELAAADEDLRSLVYAERCLRLGLKLLGHAVADGGLDDEVALALSVTENRMRRTLASATLTPQGRFGEADAEFTIVVDHPDSTPAHVTGALIGRGFARAAMGRLDEADADFDEVAARGRVPLAPAIVAQAAWGRAFTAGYRGDLAAAMKHARRAESVAMSEFAQLSTPFLCDMVITFGALGDLDLADEYLARARDDIDTYGKQIRTVEFIHAARRGVRDDLAGALADAQPYYWPRMWLVAAYAAARHGDRVEAERLLTGANRELERCGFAAGEFGDEQPTFARLRDLLGLRLAVGATTATGVVEVRVVGPTVQVWRADGVEATIAGPKRRELIALIAANGGRIAASTAAGHLWPDEAAAVAGRRLHNLAVRTRDDVGFNLRDGSDFRFPEGTVVDLEVVDGQLDTASRMLRRDPDGAEVYAFEAVTALATGLFGEFDAAWADDARYERAARGEALLEFLQVRADDDGNRALAGDWAAVSGTIAV